MEVYRGKSVFGGIAMGTIRVYQKGQQQVKRLRIEDPEQELLRYGRARAEAVAQLGELYEKALKEVGEANAAIFEMHQIMLEDEDYNDSVENIIRTEQVNAEYAVASTADNFAMMFSSMEDEYMKERAADVKDISERLLSVLGGQAGGGMKLTEPVIVAAGDLAPSETVQLEKDMVLSFVTLHGSQNSHTAILARTMGIPALVGTRMKEQAAAERGTREPDALESETADMEKTEPETGTRGTSEEAVLSDWDGKFGIVDGITGTFYVDPDEETLTEYRKRQEAEAEKKRLLETLKGKENVTLDGQRLMLYANIGNIKDLAMVLHNDAEGIGLFRSEFIYLEQDRFPTEEEQFSIYKTVVSTMAGKRVVIRTLDIGADKQCEYFHLEKEENPAMGCRAIRICLTRPEIFKTQLRALFRASVYGKLAIMYPMITSVKEIRRIKEIVAEVKAELTEQGIAFGEPEQGIMIETPAAALVSLELAKEVDFFSIGTNDLTQYTLAIDRQNPKLDEFYDPHHPAILRLIAMVTENAHRAGIWAGICGELGADPELTREFLAMGVDELSVSPGSILPIRKLVRETDVAEYRKRRDVYADGAEI